MTIAQINSTKTEFTFFGKSGLPRTIFASTLLSAKKNYNKRFASNDITEIHFRANVITKNTNVVDSGKRVFWNITPYFGEKAIMVGLNQIDTIIDNREREFNDICEYANEKYGRNYVLTPID